MRHYLSLSILAFLLISVPGFSAEDTMKCFPSCAQEDSDGVVIDLQNTCMCIGDDCFKIGIGKGGPSMTGNGEGQITSKGCSGAKYQNVSAPGSDKYDKDCFSTNIPKNDNVGKWLHKPQGCHDTSHGPEASKGCMLVPCSKWPDVENFVSDNGGAVGIKICGGSDKESSGGKHSAESDEKYNVPDATEQKRRAQERANERAKGKGGILNGGQR